MTPSEKSPAEYTPITALRYISIIERNTRRYYDNLLESSGIGSGQQFFLLRIFENDGISMYDLAKLGNFDKGTVTKAVQRMVEQGYVRSEQDQADHRVRRLHVTETAMPLIRYIYQIRDAWTDGLTRELDEEARERLLSTLRQMAEYSCQLIQQTQGNQKGANCNEP